MFRSLRNLLPVLAIVALAMPARAQFVVQQGTTYTLTLPDLIASSDHISGLTAQTGTAYLTRVTGSSGAVTKAASTNNITEIDSVNAPGQYTLTLSSTETAALGWIKGYYKSASSDPVSFTVRVVAFNPDDATALGLSRLDASVSSRSTYAGADTSGTTTLLSRIPGTVQPQTGDSYARLGAPAGASIAADIAGVAGSVWGVGSRTLTAFGFTPTVAVGSYASGQDPGTMVWEALTASHQTNGTFGKYVSSITGGGGGTDPLTNPLSGYTTPGTGGYALAKLNGLTITSGAVNLNLAQALDPTNLGDTVGGGLIGARGQAFGKWVISGSTLTMYAADGTTVLRTFTISPTPSAASRQ